MEFNVNKPIYLQIVDHVYEMIATNQWRAEMRIPSVRELGSTLEVNPNTVARSYEVLQSQDIIQNKRGIGYFVSEHAREQVHRIRKQEFMEKDMPALFKSMVLLDISMSEVKEHYDNYKKKHSNHEKK